jgi:hypothetical protein
MLLRIAAAALRSALRVADAAAGALVQACA